MSLTTAIKSFLDAISGDEKFLMTLGAGVVNTCLLILGLLGQESYVSLTQWTVCVYIAGKTYEDTKKAL